MNAKCRLARIRGNGTPLLLIRNHPRISTCPFTDPRVSNLTRGTWPVTCAIRSVVPGGEEVDDFLDPAQQ